MSRIGRLVLLAALTLALAALVHLATVLALPRLATQDSWARVMALSESEGITVLPPARPGETALPLMDPAFVYAVCPYDLGRRPLAIRAPMPASFWAVSFHRPHGVVYYAVNDAAATSDHFEIELRNAPQTRRLRTELTEPAEQVLHIEAPENVGFALFRALAPGRSGRAAVEAALEGIECAPLSEDAPAAPADPAPSPPSDAPEPPGA